MPSIHLSAGLDFAISCSSGHTLMRQLRTALVPCVDFASNDGTRLARSLRATPMRVPRMYQEETTGAGESALGLVRCSAGGRAEGRVLRSQEAGVVVAPRCLPIS